jgi:hypothetical protein
MKLGFALQTLSASQLSFEIIRDMNIVSAFHPEVSVSLFVNRNERPCVETTFPVFELLESFDFDGLLVVTDLDLARRAIHLPSPKKKIWLMYDLGWQNPDSQFESWCTVARHPELKIACRSQSHATIIRDAFDVDVMVVNSPSDFLGLRNDN